MKVEALLCDICKTRLGIKKCDLCGADLCGDLDCGRTGNISLAGIPIDKIVKCKNCSKKMRDINLEKDNPSLKKEIIKHIQRVLVIKNLEKEK